MYAGHVDFVNLCMDMNIHIHADMMSCRLRDSLMCIFFCIGICVQVHTYTFLST
jgi:hypothetical protein